MVMISQAQTKIGSTVCLFFIFLLQSVKDQLITSLKFENELHMFVSMMYSCLVALLLRGAAHRAVLCNTRKLAFKKWLCGWCCCSLLSRTAGFSSHSELRGRGAGGLVAAQCCVIQHRRLLLALKWSCSTVTTRRPLMNIDQLRLNQM